MNRAATIFDYAACGTRPSVTTTEFCGARQLESKVSGTKKTRASSFAHARTHARTHARRRQGDTRLRTCSASRATPDITAQRAYPLQLFLQINEVPRTVPFVEGVRNEAQRQTDAHAVSHTAMGWRREWHRRSKPAVLLVRGNLEHSPCVAPLRGCERSGAGKAGQAAATRLPFSSFQ